MAAPITTNATHAEQQVLEVANAIRNLEKADLALVTPTLEAQRVFIAPDFDDETVTITMTLPITVVTDDDGGMSFDVNEVL